nr:MAG TPA: Mind bomb SH3 repeat domain [Caudoviricetes sp.]
MRYKVGDKVRVRSDLEKHKEYGGWYTSEGMVKIRGEIVTIREVKSSSYELEENDFRWTDEMLEPVEDELTAEEAIKTWADMCDIESCADCKVGKLVKEAKYSFCSDYRREHPDKVVEVLKQLKKEHEKKEVEVTQKIYCLVVDEERKVVHEEEIGNSDSCMDVLKNYCENHDGKFFSLMEFRYEVKQ